MHQLIIVYVENFSFKFDETFKVTSVPFFIPGFNSLSCELVNLYLKYHIESFENNIILKQNRFTILSQFLEKNLNWFLSVLQQFY